MDISLQNGQLDRPGRIAPGTFRDRPLQDIKPGEDHATQYHMQAPAYQNHFPHAHCSHTPCLHGGSLCFCIPDVCSFLVISLQMCIASRYIAHDCVLYSHHGCLFLQCTCLHCVLHCGCRYLRVLVLDLQMLVLLDLRCRFLRCAFMVSAWQMFALIALSDCLHTWLTHT